MDFTKKVEEKIKQEETDCIEAICIEEFKGQLTVDKKYYGYLIKKHDFKDGVRIMMTNDEGTMKSYPIRWFKFA